MDRRQFLVLLGGAYGCAATATYQGRVEGGRVLVPLAELPPTFSQRGYALVRAAGLEEPVLILMAEDSGFQAVGARCTHLGCQVRPSRSFLLCPCHGSTFSWDGAVVRGPAQKPLAQYPVEVREGVLEIAVNRKD